MKKDVIIGLPVYDGRIGMKTYNEVLAASADPECCVAGNIQLVGDSLVTRARNKIVKRFLETDYEYLMFVDSDIEFSRRQIDALRSHGKKLIGGVYLKKKLPYSPVCNRFLGQEDGLNKMAEMGTGFLMIHRSVFEAIREKTPEHVYKPEGDEEKGDYYDYFRVGVVEGRYLSEDYYFCYLARQAGFDVWMDGNILVTHVGHAAYPFNDKDLIEGATELIANYDLGIEMDMVMIEKLKQAIKVQEEARNAKATNTTEQDLPK
jgi:hypothetical protein